MELMFVENILQNVMGIVIFILEILGATVSFYGAVYSFYRFIRLLYLLKLSEEGAS